MRILITGAAGFIGSHLADRLVADGHSVSGFDNLATGNMRNVNPDVDFWSCDVAEWGVCNADLIIHCAASYSDPNDWHRDTRTNVVGTINMVRTAQQCGARLFYFQTALCYGNNPRNQVEVTSIGGPREYVYIDGPVTTSAPLAPESSYAISKTAGESYIRHSGVPYVSFRLANIYGPRNLSGPIPTFYRRLSRGETCTVVDSRRDFVYIDDLVDLVMRVMDSDYVGVLHAASGRDYSIRELYDNVAGEFLNARLPIEIPRGPDDAATILLDPSETYERFGWKATTRLEIGIWEACAWYFENEITDTYTHLALRG